MLESTIVNYNELKTSVKSLVKENISLQAVLNDVNDQIYNIVTNNYLQEGDMITGIELSAGLTKSGNPEILDFINIESIEWNNDNLSLKVKY